MAGHRDEIHLSYRLWVTDSMFDFRTRGSSTFARRDIGPQLSRAIGKNLPLRGQAFRWLASPEGSSDRAYLVEQRAQFKERTATVYENGRKTRWRDFSATVTPLWTVFSH